MTRTDRRGNPILDGVETAVAAARLPSRSSTDAPPPDFRRPAIAGPLYFVSTALESSALPHARTAPQTPLESRQGACPMDSAQQAGRAEGFQRPQAKTSQHLRAISLSHGGEMQCRWSGQPGRLPFADSWVLRRALSLLDHPILRAGTAGNYSQCFPSSWAVYLLSWASSPCCSQRGYSIQLSRLSRRYRQSACPCVACKYGAPWPYRDEP